MEGRRGGLTSSFGAIGLNLERHWVSPSVAGDWGGAELVSGPGNKDEMAAEGERNRESSRVSPSPLLPLDEPKPKPAAKEPGKSAAVFTCRAEQKEGREVMKRQTGNDQQTSPGLAHSRYSAISRLQFLFSQRGTECSRLPGTKRGGHVDTGRWEVASVTDSLLTSTKFGHFISWPFEILRSISLKKQKQTQKPLPPAPPTF